MSAEQKIHLLLDETRLTIIPSLRVIEQELTFEEKTMEVSETEPWKGPKVRRKQARAFDVIDTEHIAHARITHTLFTYASFSDGQLKGIQCPHGLWHRVIELLKKLNIPYQTYDIRLPYPEPKLQLMNGFRFSQKQLLTDFLNQRMSGILEAPTRYGKSHLILNMLRAYSGIPTVVTAPGEDLLGQLHKFLQAHLIGRDVKIIYSGRGSAKFSGDDVTVCSMDSLHKCDHGKIKLVIADEIQSLVTDARLDEFLKFNTARILGVSATAGGRFDNRDILIEGVIGPILARRTFQEAVAEGAICQIVVIVMHIPLTRDQVRRMPQRNKMMNNILWMNPNVAHWVGQLCERFIPADWQTLCFVKHEKPAEFLQEFIPGSEIAMAKRLNKKEREAMMDKMASGELKRSIASDIYSQGVTFSDLRAMINVSGGGKYFGSVQKPGRLAETRPGKKAGILFEFNFISDGTWQKEKLHPDVSSILDLTETRLQVYSTKGYQIIHVRTPRELQEALQPVL